MRQRQAGFSDARVLSINLAKEFVMTETTEPQVRTGQADFPMTQEEFNARFRARFADPAFANKEALIDELMETAWDGYRKARKSPITQKAGPAFADPDYDLSVDWLAARNAINDAQTRHEGVGPNRVLLICGATVYCTIVA
jgi:hypothetical protein